MTANPTGRLKQRSVLKAIAGLLIALASNQCHAASGKIYSRFGYCAPPFTPS